MFSDKNATRSHIDRILSAAEGVQHGAAATGVASSSLVEMSWRRCLTEYRLDPTRLAPVDVATEPETRARAEALEDLLPAALAVLPDLCEALRDYNYLLLLSDPDGVILRRLGDLGTDHSSAEAEVSPGAIWAERRQGTNGIGTSLACGTTAAVHFMDHFAPGNAWLSCVSTPVRGPTGKVAGALNVTFLKHRTRAGLSGSAANYLMERAGRRIEDRFVIARSRDNWILRLSAEDFELGDAQSAMLAVDRQERIAGLNEAARRLFAGRPECSVGQSLQELLGCSLEDVLRHQTGDKPVTVALGALRLHTRIRAPLTASPARANGTAPSAPAVVAPAVQPLTKLGLHDVMGEDIGLAASIPRLRRFIDQKVPILIGGETGTGKEVLALALHEASSRRAKPFVAINCAALPDALVESELFGYADGAFTGASRRGYQGKLVQASGGTLFLDEIGDMPMLLQTRLLRALTQEEVCPLGSDRVVRVSLNVMSASHRRLEELVAQGQFRADLLYRLRGIEVTLPALRDRTDMTSMIHGVLAAEARQLDVPADLDEAARETLVAYRWPGNLRELRHVLRASLVACSNGVVTRADLPGFVVDAVASAGAPAASFPARRATMQAGTGCFARNPARAAHDHDAQTLTEMLRQHAWRVADVARKLGISRQAVYRAMQRHGIVSPNQMDAAYPPGEG